MQSVMHPGHYNDADMLQVGDPGGLSIPEARTHFATWVVTSSNLLIGAALRGMDPEAMHILQAKEVI